MNISLVWNVFNPHRPLLIVAALVVALAASARAQSDDGAIGGGFQQPSAPIATATPEAQRGAQYQSSGDDSAATSDNGPATGGQFSAGAAGQFGVGHQPGPGFGGGLSSPSAGAPGGFNNGPGLSANIGLGGGPADLALTAQKLGLTPAEFAGIRNQLTAGTLTPDELQQLCVRFAARQVAPTDVDSIARAIGISLTDSQRAQLRSCTQMAAPEGSSGTPEPALGRQTPPAAVVPPSELSSIERSFHALDSGLAPIAPTAQSLSQFGYSLFDSRVSTFAPVSSVPVGKDYEIGPGDELKVLIWGRVNDKLDLVVQRDGSVLMPQIGPLQVAGLTFEQAKKLIEDRSEQITGVQADVTMGRLRTIQVFVIGEVRQPGAYTVSALARVSNVLAASGGITKVGSLRRIELRRANQVARQIDLYDMLQYGNTSEDAELEPNDVIFVPVIGPVTAIAGDVKRPAIYELAHSGEILDGVLKLAGGISAFGYAQRVQVERVQNHQRRIALDVDLSQLGSRRFAIEDGDLIKIYPVLPQQKEIVTAKGNLNRPGNYQWYSGMRVADLVREAEGVAPRTFFRYALIRRLAGPDKAVRLVPIDLSAALASADRDADAELESQDTLTVFNEDQIKDLPTVQVFGEVRNPGFYVLDHGMRVSDLVYLAGGLRDDAYLTKAELARTQVVNGQRTSHTYEDLDLRAAMAGSESNNPVLAPNDQVFVRKASDWHLPWVVQVKGRVLRPGPYTIHEGERLAALLERCGGLLPDAYPTGAIFIRQSIRELEQKRLDQARQQLQEAVARYQLQPAGLDQDQNQSSKADPNALLMLQKVLEQTQGQQAQGRLVVHLLDFDRLAQSQDNIVLEDQDQILIPRRPASVNVLGQVYSPNAIVWQPQFTVRDYLERAGGPNEGGDHEHIFVIKADGSIVTDEGLKSGVKATMFPLLPAISGGLMGQHLEPGDTVFVPTRLYYSNKLKLYGNIAQILASSAQGVAIVALAAGL